MRDSAQAVAIIGSGPAGLMAAEVLSSAGVRVEIFEKRKSPARKLLVAGSSGLNIGNCLPLEEFARYFSGPEDLWNEILREFGPPQWIHFVETLGFKTFE